MCGFVAIFSYRKGSPPVQAEEIVKIRDSMIPRGPDGAGLWVHEGGGIGLGHRRLSIIDLSANGAQPMEARVGAYRIVFNGEIYNYRVLRSELEGKGYNFHSSSDTEVLLHLYADRGERMVHDLRGMFTFALWDEAKKGLFVARDPFGIKPLYYSDDGSTVRIASQVKALIKSGSIDLGEEPAGHVGFFLWGHIPEPFTLYKNIRAVPAGATLWVDERGVRGPLSYFNLADELKYGNENESFSGTAEKRFTLRSALEDSIRHHLVSDVPVGIFLSSGRDSSTITAIASEVNAGDLYTITVGFEEYRGTLNDETLLAKRVAEYYGTRHETYWYTNDNFLEDREKLLHAMDQPSIDGVNTYIISKAAAKSGLKVILSGVGGDEFFGGYSTFREVPNIVRMCAPAQHTPRMGKMFRYIFGPVMKRFTSPKYAGLLEYGGTYGGAYILHRGLYMPWEMPDIFDGEFVKEGWRQLQMLPSLENIAPNLGSGYARVTALEISCYMRNQLLRDTDWAGMAHSLEIRVPFVDVSLFREIAPWISCDYPPTKLDMAMAPKKSLPKEIINKGKTGFSIPVAEWMRHEKGNRERGLRGWARYVYDYSIKH